MILSQVHLVSVLCDGNNFIIAASKSSGLQEVRTAPSQTPAYQ